MFSILSQPYHFYVAHLFLDYIFFASSFFVFCFVLFYKKFISRKLQQQCFVYKDIMREISLSCLTILIFGLAGMLTLGNSHVIQQSKIYFDIWGHGFVYFLLAFPILLFAHDTYFYWTHRMLHQRFFYRYIHAIHHRFSNPSPFAAYAFHPIEAVIQALFIYPMILLIPLHPLHIATFFIIMVGYNTYGHSGYELFNKRFMKSFIGKWFNTSTYHNLHHEKYDANFGLYFTIWDYLFNSRKIEQQ